MLAGIMYSRITYQLYYGHHWIAPIALPNRPEGDDLGHHKHCATAGDILPVRSALRRRQYASGRHLQRVTVRMIQRVGDPSPVSTGCSFAVKQCRHIPGRPAGLVFIVRSTADTPGLRCFVSGQRRPIIHLACYLTTRPPLPSRGPATQRSSSHRHPVALHLSASHAKA